jgi:hypothetical protein
LCSYQAPKGEQLFCFSMSDDLIAAGGQSKVLFWDRRKHSQLEAFGDVHSDDVTQVCVCVCLFVCVCVCVVCVVRVLLNVHTANAC